jgi:hypothetical protein
MISVIIETMNRIFYNTLLFVSSLFIGGAIIILSIRAENVDTKTMIQKSEKVWSKISLTSPSANTYKVEEEIVDVKTTKVSQNTPMLVDFWRLSSFLYLAPVGSQEGVLTQSGTTGVIIGDVSGIISLYDLFLSYTIYEKNNTFRLEQITNGSFYLGKEKDGKVAIYAIDGVVRLTLINEGKDMTNLILFPGSYIRFDPKRNRSLNNADLFRTILSLKDTDNEVFEFVNPRVNIGDEQDTFFNYRLPNISIVLFRALSARFKDKVDAKNNIRQKYRLYGYDETTDDSKWLLNPSKKNHNMLVELSYLLSKALDTNVSSNAIIGKIGTLYKQASDLDIRDSTAKSLVEQFLLDGRFAQYGGSVNPKYQESYENIARIIWIERIDAKWQLFQNLADIYSRNLFNQKKTDTWLYINTYSPTAAELAKTLEKNEIPQKDYFDIAIYAYNIVRKMEEKSQLLWLTTMEDNSTYTYLLTFFRASNRYIDSIDDAEKKQQTIMSFSRQFYDYMLTLIVNSLYRSFVVAEDGALYLNPNYREGVKVILSEEMADNILTLDATIQAIAPSIQSVWSGSGQADTDTYTRMVHNILRLNAFKQMINPDTYKDYIKTPYKLSTSENDIQLPMIDPETNLLIRIDPKTVEKIQNTKTLATDPRIQELKKIWPDADASSLSIEEDNIRITKAPYKIGRSGEGISEVTMSALYKDKALSDMIVYYDNYILRIVTEQPLSLQSYKAFLTQLDSYLKFVDDEVISQNREVGEMRIFPTKKRMNIGDSMYDVPVDAN